MANAASLVGKAPARILITGWPGAAKTGCLAALANVGYKLRVLDYEGNYAPLLNYVKPEFLKNIDIVTFQDKLSGTQNPQYISPIGVPNAFNNSLKQMQDWKTEDADGNPISLGASKDWGLDTIVVTDTITGMGEGAFKRAQVMMNKTPMNTTQQVWGMAVADQLNFIKLINAQTNRFHHIALAHLTMIGPADITKDDSDLTKELKEAVAELLPTRYYPKGVTKNFSQTLAKEFPVHLLAERKMKGGKPDRYLKLETGDELDLKFPVPNAPSRVPIDTGMATVFELLGYTPPAKG
jgi:hypothetical protein